jgi:DnaJ-class molecular chaperone
MVSKKQRKFTIDTSVDKICYQKCYFLNNEEGYVDIIFNIIPKEHFIKRIGRYDLQIDYNISLYEMYFGGFFNLNYLDGKKYKMIWDAFGNNNFENNKKIENMGLHIKNEENIKIRGDLIINFKLVLPKFEELTNNSNIDIIKELFNNKTIKNNLGNFSSLSEEVIQYNIIKMT